MSFLSSIAGAAVPAVSISIRLTPPSNAIYLISLVLIAAGAIAHFTAKGRNRSTFVFWTLFSGAVLLLLGSLFKGL
ncbi:MAG: hypothetical protein ACOX6J_04590 [Oscillospiraceae bacterium]|jgi:hypothetical protein